jgi:ribose transport system substrate-binding protein
VEDVLSRYHRRSPAVVLATTAALALLTACGGSDAETVDAASGSGEGGGEVVAAAQAAVEENRQGTDRPLPDSAPEPVADANIWIISCLEAGEGCSAPAAGAKEAGEALGWAGT